MGFPGLFVIHGIGIITNYCLYLVFDYNVKLTFTIIYYHLFTINTYFIIDIIVVIKLQRYSNE